MKKSALNFDTEEVAVFIESAPPVQKLDVSKIIVYQPAGGSPVSVPKHSSEKERRRQRRLVRFIKLEAAAFFFLIFTLAGATNELVRQAGFGSLSEVGMVVAQIGLGMGVMSKSVYGVVVFMSVATTLIAPPLIRWTISRRIGWASAVNVSLAIRLTIECYSAVD